jgi:hypothetical protein
MPAPAAKPGLGARIVEALAKQLLGHIRLVDASPGTAVTRLHDEAAGARLSAA